MEGVVSASGTTTNAIMEFEGKERMLDVKSAGLMTGWGATRKWRIPKTNMVELSAAVKEELEDDADDSAAVKEELEDDADDIDIRVRKAPSKGSYKHLGEPAGSSQ